MVSTGLHHCGDLNRKGPPLLMSLNARPTGALSEGEALLEEASQGGVGSEVSYAQALPGEVQSLHLLPADP